MSADIAVNRNGAEGRFEITVDGHSAGRLLYIDRGGRRILHHTEIDSAYGGRGLAGTLVASAVDESRRDGWRIVPVCEYVQRWLGKHREFEDTIDPVTTDAIQAAEGAQG